MLSKICWSIFPSNIKYSFHVYFLACKIYWLHHMQNGAKLFLFHTNIHCPNRMLCGLPYLCTFLKCGFASLLSPWCVQSVPVFHCHLLQSCELQPRELERLLHISISIPLGRNSIYFFKTSSPTRYCRQYMAPFSQLLRTARGIVRTLPFPLFPHLKGLSHGHYLRLGPGCLTACYSESPLGALLYMHWPRVVFQYANLS